MQELIRSDLNGLFPDGVVPNGGAGQRWCSVASTDRASRRRALLPIPCIGSINDGEWYKPTGENTSTHTYIVSSPHPRMLYRIYAVNKVRRGEQGVSSSHPGVASTHAYTIASPTITALKWMCRWGSQKSTSTSLTKKP